MVFLFAVTEHPRKIMGRGMARSGWVRLGMVFNRRRCHEKK